MIENILSLHGLTPKQVKIYLSVLELGYTSVSSIARKSKINRITCYTILKELCEKGVANEFIKDNVKYYSVISPEIFFENKKNNLQKFENILPELMAISNLYQNKPKIQFYQGIQGLKNIYEDLLKSSLPICSFLSVTQIPSELKEYLDNEFLPKRVSKGIFANVIASETLENLNYKKLDKENLRKTYVIKDKEFYMADEIIIYGEDRVSICMFPENECNGIMIQSKSLHDSLKSIFHCIFKD